MELEKSTGNTLTLTYEDTNFNKIFIGTFTKEPIKVTYYELYNKKGKLVSITENREIAIICASRNNLDYRAVEFDEIYQPVESEKKEE